MMAEGQQVESPPSRIRGVVKSFKNSIGYGFIRPEGWTKDVFVHFSELQQDGYKHLNQGDTVEFEIGKRDGRIQANKVIVIDETEAGNGAAGS